MLLERQSGEHEMEQEDIIKEPPSLLSGLNSLSVTTEFVCVYVL